MDRRCQMEDFSKVGTSRMSGHKEAKPEKSLKPQQPLSSPRAKLFREFDKDVFSQKFLERFEGKLSMEECSMVGHFKTSLGLGCSPSSNDPRRFFTLVFCLQRVIP